MKKIALLSALGLSVLLAGCNTVDNSGKKPESTDAKTSKVAKKDNREVTNGELLKVGQWTNDSSQGKLTLEKIWAPGTKITNGPLEFKIKSVKIFEVMPKNNDQISFAKDAFQATSITKPYYEIQVVYDLTNKSDKEVQFNGIKSLVTTTGQQIDTGTGLQDDGLGTSIAANATKECGAVGLLKDGEHSKIKDISITLDSVVNSETYEDISEGSEAIKITLE